MAAQCWRGDSLSHPEWGVPAAKSTPRGGRTPAMPAFRKAARSADVMPGVLRNTAGHDDADTRQPMPHKFPSTCDQMAIIPTNNASEASAAASCSTALNMTFSPERRENIVNAMFGVKRAALARIGMALQ